MGFRYRLASTLHDAYSDLGPSHILIIRILADRHLDFNNVHFFASASATASKSTRTLLRTSHWITFQHRSTTRSFPHPPSRFNPPQS